MASQKHTDILKEIAQVKAPLAVSQKDQASTADLMSRYTNRVFFAGTDSSLTSSRRLDSPETMEEFNNLMNTKPEVKIDGNGQFSVSGLEGMR